MSSMPAKRKDYRVAVDLYNGGLSIADVAGYYGITRQSMYKILRRRGVAFRPNVRSGHENRFHRGGCRAVDRSQNLLEVAVAKGLVRRLTHCEVCGFSGAFKDGRTAIQAHHDDYSKPLDVRWLCQRCHFLWHSENTAENAVLSDPIEERRWLQ